jgi:hypothetical protein
MSQKESLEEAEKNALTALRPELGRHGKLTMDVLNLIGMALGRIPEKPFKEIPLSQKVIVILLIKLSNDLRSFLFIDFNGLFGSGCYVSLINVRNGLLYSSNRLKSMFGEKMGRA